MGGTPPGHRTIRAAGDGNAATMPVFCGVAMALLLSVVLACGIFASGAAKASGSPEAAEAPNNAPRFEPVPRLAPPSAVSFLDATGRRDSLDEFVGRVVLLNLWATWCPPCVEEMPSLDRLQAQLGGGAFQVVAVSLDGGGLATVKPFFARLKLEHLGIYLDPAGMTQRVLGVNGLPTSFLLDRKGRVIGRFEGAARWDGAGTVRLIQRLIGGDSVVAFSDQGAGLNLPKAGTVLKPGH